MAELRVMDALREKRSELSGVVGRLEQQLAQHCGSLAHLDATMRPFDPNLLSQDADPAPQRGRVSWFGPGECRRLIYDVLRDAPQPLATRELAERVMAAKGIPAVDDHRTSARPWPIMATASEADSITPRVAPASESTRLACRSPANSVLRKQWTPSNESGFLIGIIQPHASDHRAWNRTSAPLARPLSRLSPPIRQASQPEPARNPGPLRHWNEMRGGMRHKAAGSRALLLSLPSCYLRPV